VGSLLSEGDLLDGDSSKAAIDTSFSRSEKAEFWIRLWGASTRRVRLDLQRSLLRCPNQASGSKLSEALQASSTQRAFRGSYLSGLPAHCGGCAYAKTTCSAV